MKVAAIVLAAGGSTRLGQPKQLLEFRGQPLVKRVVEAALAAGCAPVVVVVGEQAAAIRATLRDLPSEIVPNENWREGIGSSIRAGVMALPDCDGFVIAACDQPFVSSELIGKLIRKHHESGQSIVASAYSGTRGVPAFFARRHREELLALPNDQGAKALLARHPAEVATVDFSQGGIDIDTPANYAALQASP